MHLLTRSVSTILFVLTIFISGKCLALETKQDQIFALQAVMAELKTHYGMIKFKQEMFGTKYDDLTAKYTSLIENAQTLEEFYGFKEKENRSILPPEEFRQILIGLAAEFRDGHTNITRQSVDVWTVGIQTAGIGGKLYVTGFDSDLYIPNSSTEEIKIGDEVIEIDGRPVADLVKERSLYVPLATFETRRDRAAESLLNVSHRFFRAQQDGKAVTIKFFRKENSKSITGRFNWINWKDLREFDGIVNALRPSRPNKKKTYIYGERGRDSYFRAGLANLGLPSGSVTETGKLLNQEIAERMGPAVQNKSASNGSDGEDAKADVESDKTSNEKTVAKAKEAPITRLEAYTVHYKGKNIGVIRLPDYSPPAFEDVEREVNWLTEVIARFQISTDVLIIDQLSNGGGYIKYVTDLASVFAGDKELKSVTIDMKLNQTFLANMEGPPSPEQNFAQVLLSMTELQKMKSQFAQGETWTGKRPYMSNTSDSTAGEPGRIFRKSKTAYTKPVLLLNDSRSGSGGDFFPGILQSNDRIVVMGTESMGLGGPVYRSQSSLPGSELFMRCTFGVCLLQDGTPLENVGVMAQIRRPIERADLLEGFKTNAKQSLEAAVMLVAGKTPREIDEYIGEEMRKRDSDSKPRPSYRLPNELLKADAILASLPSKEAALERLEQMRALPRFSSVPEMRERIDTAIEELKRMENPAIRNVKCSETLNGQLQLF